ncbi:MAG: hypothetical protein KatS3mg106_636 [Gemmataceae bacterium]|jgi:hypothetical protein|nr:MAG: hypothetical protein KatS3mg106_636 [Gemmataceae bacterium]
MRKPPLRSRRSLSAPPREATFFTRSPRFYPKAFAEPLGITDAETMAIPQAKTRYRRGQGWSQEV